MESSAFSADPDAIMRTVTVGLLAYASLIVFLRVSGKRTLSKLNAFDFVVTVALGSTLATILLDRNVTLAQGCVALAVLIGLQYAITWSSVRWRWLRNAVTGEPAMLVYRGNWQHRTLKMERLTEEEVQAAVRSAGFASIGDLEAVVLETDGSLSVVRQTGTKSPGTLADVRMTDGGGDLKR